MKRLMLALAAISLFLTTVTLPSMAEGNPIPTGGGTKPPQANGDSKLPIR